MWHVIARGERPVIASDGWLVLASGGWPVVCCCE